MSKRSESAASSRCGTAKNESRMLISAVTLGEKKELHSQITAPRMTNKITHKFQK